MTTIGLNLSKFTPTEQRMLKVLLDGELHNRRELHECLNDESQPLTVISNYTHRIRKILPSHLILITEFGRGKKRGIHYRLARHLTNPNRE